MAKRPGRSTPVSSRRTTAPTGRGGGGATPLHGAGVGNGQGGGQAGWLPLAAPAGLAWKRQRLLPTDTDAPVATLADGLWQPIAAA
ncbi:hypothetical protein ACFQU2_27475 [Siccirubricoccus deserti]